MMCEFFSVFLFSSTYENPINTVSVYYYKSHAVVCIIYKRIFVSIINFN